MPGWDLDALREFLPHVKMTAANDARAGRHYRLELSAATPWLTVKAALDFEAPCVACGRTIRPFRQRTVQLPRGGSAARGAVYLSVSCPLNDRIACSRGREASAAYDALERLAAEAIAPPEGKQGVLL